MENKELNKEIIKIWVENYEKLFLISKRKICWPLLVPEFKANTILFLGINPSGDTVEEYRLNDKDELYDEHKINSLIEKEKNNMKGGYRKYFKEFQKISEEVFRDKFNFNHFDLYFYRMRSSKKFMDLVEENNEVFQKQFDLSIKIITTKISPEIIFVANKNASDILKKKLLIEENIFEKEGFDVVNVNNRKVPTFFSGMISSARSIDDYTLRRLIWHIKKASKWSKENN